MNWRKLFLITYWKRKNNFNAFTFLTDVYIILGVLAFIIYVFIIYVLLCAVMFSVAELLGTTN